MKMMSKKRKLKCRKLGLYYFVTENDIDLGYGYIKPNCFEKTKERGLFCFTDEPTKTKTNNSQLSGNIPSRKLAPQELKNLSQSKSNKPSTMNKGKF